MSDSITWLPGVDRFDANPTATVALDRARWEALGATFVEVDDGDDETPGLAVGQVDGIDFGVLDYGEDETFLLVEEAEASHERTVAVLEALASARLLVLDRDLIDVAGLQPSPTEPEVEGRLAALEARMAALEHVSSPITSLIGDTSAAYPAVVPTLLQDWLKQDFLTPEQRGQLTLSWLDDVTDYFARDTWQALLYRPGRPLSRVHEAVSPGHASEEDDES